VDQGASDEDECERDCSLKPAIEGSVLEGTTQTETVSSKYGLFVVISSY
jgi:hypothetical protein